MYFQIKLNSHPTQLLNCKIIPLSSTGMYTASLLLFHYCIVIYMAKKGAGDVKWSLPFAVKISPLFFAKLL